MKSKHIVCLCLVLALLGCAQPVKQSGHSSETQRSHAKQAHDELSSEVRK